MNLPGARANRNISARTSAVILSQCWASHADHAIYFPYSFHGPLTRLSSPLSPPSPSPLPLPLFLSRSFFGTPGVLLRCADFHVLCIVTRCNEEQTIRGRQREMQFTLKALLAYLHLRKLDLHAQFVSIRGLLVTGLSLSPSLSLSLPLFVIHYMTANEPCWFRV